MKVWLQRNRILATLIPVLLVMALIFGFSCQTGDESGELSSVVTRFLVQLFAPDFDTWTVQMQEEVCTNVRLVIRKGAHFAEFALLGFCLMLHIDAIGRKIALKFPWLMAWAIGTAYAVTDELHQFFVGGRNAAAVDVCIDSCGVIAGVALMLWLLRRKTTPTK